MAEKRYTKEQLRRAKEIVDQEEAIDGERLRRRVKQKSVTRPRKFFANSSRLVGVLAAVCAVVAIALTGYRTVRTELCMAEYKIAQDERAKQIDFDILLGEWVSPPTWEVWQPRARFYCEDEAGWIGPVYNSDKSWSYSVVYPNGKNRD
jgi:hypothetical protein